MRLAETMVQIGEAVGRRTVALITNMDAPLGNAVGNTLRCREAVETLEGHGPSELTTICRELAANMLYLAGKGDIIHCNKLAREAILTGAALAKFKEMVAAQGGDVSVIEDTQKLPAASDFRRVKAPMDGYITHIDAEKCGLAAAMLGARTAGQGRCHRLHSGHLLQDERANRWTAALSLHGSTPRETRHGLMRQSVCSWRR